MSEVTVVVDSEKFDVVDFVIRFEGGDIETEEEIIDGFQHLIDSGTVWGLQGSYGRTAAALIEAGHCVDTHNVISAPARIQPKPEKIGTRCECGAPYVFLERHNAWGYQCAR